MPSTVHEAMHAAPKTPSTFPSDSAEPLTIHTQQMPLGAMLSLSCQTKLMPCGAAQQTTVQTSKVCRAGKGGRMLRDAKHHRSAHIIKQPKSTDRAQHQKPLQNHHKTVHTSAMQSTDTAEHSTAQQTQQSTPAMQSRNEGWIAASIAKHTGQAVQSRMRGCLPASRMAGPSQVGGRSPSIKE